MPDILKNLFSFENGIPMGVVSVIITVISNIFFALAISTDAKLNHKKGGNLWASAAFFFGAVAAGFYFAFRNMLKEEVPIVCAFCGKKALKNRQKCPHCGGTRFVPLQFENRSAVKNRIIAFLAAAIVLFVFNIWFTDYSPWAPSEQEIADEIINDMFDEDYFHYGYEVNGELVYYDREGNSYNDVYEVVYYDKNSNKYTYDSNKGFVSETDEISDEDALVDSNGYILSAYSEFESIPNVLPFKTQDGIMYYSAKTVSWNSEGEMVYTSNGKVINNN